MTEMILCCGQGGVGKTTLSAAHAVGLAMQGARVVVITIDPAKRLADALGLHSLPNQPTTIQRFEGGGVLDAMMLDCQTTWNELIQRYTRDDAFAAEIIANRYYQAVSSRLPGSHEYMAIEKLYELTETGNWDFVVVDTPPARHLDALLKAPARIGALFEGRVMRAWTQPSTGWLHATTRKAFQLLERLAGQQVLGEVREFLTLLSELGDGCRERSQAVLQILTSEHCRAYFVTPPERVEADAMERARTSLEAKGLQVAGAWMNRMEPRPTANAPLPQSLAKEKPEVMDWPLWCEALNQHHKRLLAAQLAGAEIDRAVPAIGEVVGGALFEGGILVAGKFFDSGIPDTLAGGGINKR